MSAVSFLSSPPQHVLELTDRPTSTQLNKLASQSGTQVSLAPPPLLLKKLSPSYLAHISGVIREVSKQTSIPTHPVYCVSLVAPGQNNKWRVDK